MKSPTALPRRPVIRFSATIIALTLAALCLIASSGRSFAADAVEPNTAALALPPQAPNTAAVPEALLAKLSKILTYGDIVSFNRPSKVDAAVALGLLGDERAIPILADHLENEANNHLRMQIARALGWIDSQQAVPALEKALRDSYPHTRHQAAIALKTITGRDYDYDKTGLPNPAELMEALRQSRKPSP